MTFKHSAAVIAAKGTVTSKALKKKGSERVAYGRGLRGALSRYRQGHNG